MNISSLLKTALTAFVMANALTPLSSHAKTVHYELTATRGSVNLSGKRSVDFALMINGSIPAPTLEFTEGDDAEIVVKNQIPGEELSLHWHGILLPVEMDGVPYLTTPSILTGESFTFRFKIRQHGTYWYHSHTNVQEQKGLYGALVLHPQKSSAIQSDREAVVVLSDWSDENATDILKNLKKDGDYYLGKKDTVRSWLGAIQAKKLDTYLMNEWTRMGGMDLSDVGYDAFLINGKSNSQLLTTKPGERVRLRFINAAASTYFYVTLGQHPMKVVAADGVDIRPTLANKLLMGMAETYDVLFEAPKGINTELKITAQDGTGSASTWLGSGAKASAPIEALPDLYASMDHSSHAGHSSHSDHTSHEAGGSPSHHEMHAEHHGSQAKESIHPLLTVDQLQATQNTAFPTQRTVHELKLVLGGDMSRYVWHLNGKAIHEERNIEVHEGDVMRFTFVNETMMHHPMHLHGHFFRVLTQAGERSPLKHTVDVPPHGTRIIEFLANEPGEWMLHCHNLFHMKTGMARVAKYLSYTPKPALLHHQKHDPHLHDHWYWYGRAEAATNHAQGYLRLSQTWNQLEVRTEGKNTAGKNLSFSEPWEFEGDVLYRRWIDSYLNLVQGVTLFDKNVSAVAGVAYKLPFLIESQVLLSHRGQLRINLEKKFQWTRTVFTDVDLVWRPSQGHHLGKDLEFEVSLMYSPDWHWAAGLMLTDDSLGAGAQIQF